MTTPDFLSFARLMNGVCASCGKINAHDGSPRCDCVQQERDPAAVREQEA